MFVVDHVSCIVTKVQQFFHTITTYNFMQVTGARSGYSCNTKYDVLVGRHQPVLTGFVSGSLITMKETIEIANNDDFYLTRMIRKLDQFLFVSFRAVCF